MGLKNTSVAIFFASALAACGSTERERSLCEEAGALCSKAAHALELVAEAEAAITDAPIGLLGALIFGAQESDTREVLELAGDRPARADETRLDVLATHARDMRGRLDSLGRLVTGSASRGPSAMMQVQLSADALGR
jgi:hypothetical protein